MNSIVASGKLLRIVFATMIGFTAATISAKALGQYAAVRPTNPFSAFAALLPGEPESVIQDYPFSCWMAYSYGYGTEKRCSFNPKDGLISNIDLGLDHGVIVQTIFTVRDSTVQVGDLSAWLETNPKQTYPGVALFTSHKLMIIAKISGHTPHSSLFDTVWNVTLIEKSAVD